MNKWISAVATGEDTRLELRAGAGFSVAAQTGETKEYSTGSPDLEVRIVDGQVGVLVRPEAELAAGALSVSTMARYRYLRGQQRIEYDRPDFLEDEEYDFESQILTLRGTATIDLKSVKPLLGLQFENIVQKRENRDTWPDWPKDWEAMVFIGLAIPIR